MALHTSALRRRAHPAQTRRADGPDVHPPRTRSPEDKSEESSVATWFMDETRRADSWIERTAHGVYGLTEWRKARKPPDTET